MSKMKRILAAMLLVCTMLLNACASQDTGNDTTADTADSTETTVAETTLPGPDVPAEGFDGATFTIYTRFYSADSFIVEESGDVMDDALYKRILDTEEALNVDIVSQNGADDAYGTYAKNTILAGDDAYQLICGHARMMFTYTQAELVLDWYDLPYINFSNEWWDDNMLDGLSIGGKIYIVADDLTANALGNTKALLFNKNLFTKYKLEYPYQDVLDMKWTLDKMAELCAVFSDDINGDSALKIEDDQFGLGTSIWGAPINILWSSGQRIYDTTGEDGRLELVVNTPKTIEVFEKFFALLNSDSGYLGDSDAVFEAAFKDGRMAFVASSLDGLVSTRDMNDDIGIIPYPMFDLEQGSYYTGVDASCNGLAVPITVQDLNMTSSVIEYMCYLNYRDIIPVYYDVVLKTKSSRDDESAAMIDIIRESRFYDIGYFYNGLIMNSIGAELANMNDANFSTYYAQHETAAKAMLATVNEYYFEE
ncbi:MAG: extracellular solute-binding protein [Clostridia bacterium]|nr:extracellular solute-binding protein [Clostridia bacterium]